MMKLTTHKKNMSASENELDDADLLFALFTQIAEDNLDGLGPFLDQFRKRCKISTKNFEQKFPFCSFNDIVSGRTRFRGNLALLRLVADVFVELAPEQVKKELQPSVEDKKVCLYPDDDADAGLGRGPST